MVGDFNDIALEHIRRHFHILPRKDVIFSLLCRKKEMKCAPFLLFLMIKFSPRITEKGCPISWLGLEQLAKLLCSE